ncbi:MAG: efflux RND transporter permease subunit [Verrucomicrobiota bacterium]
MSEEKQKKPHPLAALFVQNRHLLVLFVMVAIVGGLSALKGLPRLEDPVITNRFPLVITAFPGASADRVESLVSEKIEQELKEIPEIKHIDSTSRAGVSVISIELADAVTAETNKPVFSEIRDRIGDAAATFPPEVLPPDFDDKRNAVAFTLTTALKWEDGSEEKLGILTRQAEELADRLRAVSGTELVRLYGEPDEEIAVTVDQDELAALGLTMDAVSVALQRADAKVPSGQLRGREASILVEVQGELDSVERIRSVPLLVDGDTGRTVRVGDVAAVGRGYRDPPGEIAVADGGRAVYVAARVLDDRRVDEWSAAAKAVVAQFREDIGGGIVVEDVFDQETYTTERLSDLSGNLLLGALVVLAVVFVTMGWRSSLIVGLALPMTASLTLFVVALNGGALHQMSIFGMIIALGLLIDNAIVMTDEVGKNRRKGLGPVDAMSAAVRHLFLPLLSSTLTTMLAFMPILLLPGNAGDFVSSIASSVIVALGASFLVAMTVIGAFAALWGGAGKRVGDGGVRGEEVGRRWWVDGVRAPRLVKGARAAIGFLVERPYLGIGTALVVPIVGFLAAGTLGSQFFPRTDRNMFEVEVWLPTESSVENTRRVAEEIEATIRERAAVSKVDWLVGGSFPPVYYNLVMNQDGASNYAHGIVTATDFESVSAMIGGLQEEIDEKFPEAQVVVTKFAQGPPVDADVEIRLLGPGIETLQDLGEEVRVLLAEHPGILQTQVTMPRGEPKLWLNADEEEARLAGLRLTDIAGQLQGKLEGRTGGSVLEGIEEMPVRIRYDRERRDDVVDIEDANLVTSGGEEWIPLAALGEMELRPEQGGITRRDGVRVNQVFGFARPDALAIGITSDVIAALDEKGFVLPAGYRLEVGGESENQAEAVGNLMLYLPVILVLTVAILILSFRSVRIASILLMVAPLSAGFGLLATWAMQFPLSFNTIIGSMGLMGLAFNSSIVVLAAIRADGRAKAGETGAIVTAVLGSGRHLVSTTLTTMGSFLPLLIFIGGQFWPPLAIVLVGGVGGSTLLAMTFTPAMYRLLACPEQKVCLFHRWLRRRRERSAAILGHGAAA